MPNVEEFKSALEAEFKEAQRRGAPAVEIEAGQLHRKVGGYPTPFNRMPVCCAVMWGERRESDAIVSQPPKGNGASLKIRYLLPR
jgi:5-methylcytosine-specific restriction protein A